MYPTQKDIIWKLWKRIYRTYFPDYPNIIILDKVTATGLSEILEGEISHDKITRFLSKEEYTSKELWQLVKKDVRRVEEEDGSTWYLDDTGTREHNSKEEVK